MTSSLANRLGPRGLERMGLSSRIGRREIFLWVAFALTANGVLQLLYAQTATTFIGVLETQNYVLWLAGYAFIYRLWLSSPVGQVDSRDLWFAVATLLALFAASLFAHRWGLGIVSTMPAVYLMLTCRGDKNLRSASSLLFAISAHLAWGPIFFLAAGPEVVQGDAAIVAGMLKIARPDIVWNDTSFTTPNGHGLVLVGACSSFQNISTALLACVTATMLTRPAWIKRDIGVIILAALAMIGINTARLCLLAWDHDSFEYWHNGDGASVFLFLQTLVALTVAWWGAATGRPKS